MTNSLSELGGLNMCQMKRSFGIQRTSVLVGLLAFSLSACSGGSSSGGGNAAGSGGNGTSDTLKRSDACATLTRYAYRGIPATFIDDGADLLYILAGSFEFLERSDIALEIEAIVELTYQGPAGQLSAKSRLMSLADLHCDTPQPEGEDNIDAQLSPPTSGSSNRSNSQVTPSPSNPTFAPEPTVAPTTTLSPDQLRRLAEQSFEQLASGYSGVSLTRLIDSCNTIQGLLVRSAYLEHYEFSEFDGSWRLLSSMDFPGQVLSVTEVDVLNNGEPELMVLWDSSFDDSDMKFGTVVGSRSGGCGWGKIPAFPSGISFPTGIANLQIVGSQVIGTDLQGNPTSYSYDASTHSFRENP